jgi:pimeloyl-ACP methyl ester carboxylesterase
VTKNIYALLVGIDKYPSPVPQLQGCVNDVMAVKEYLEGRVTSDEFQLNLRILTDQEATRQAIVDSFQQHLCQATSNDVAFFYYSGHGSQELAPEDFWHLEPDHLDETLVCWDSRKEGGWDLADKELAYLISKVAQKNPHITIIMDCCHSGSGTRDPLQETAVRRVPTDKRLRPLESFIFSPEEVGSLSTSRSLEDNPSGWDLPKGRHIFLAGCRDNEEAKEFYGEGQHRGAFCYFLMDTLKKANGSLTYRDLFKRANAIVRSKVTAQSPQLEATHLEDLDQPFLGGAIAQRTPYFTVSHHNEYGWVIDGGAVHGIAQPSDSGTTLLALFPFDSTPEQLRQLPQAVGEAEITKVLPQLSQLEITRGNENLTSDTTATFKAVVTSLPLPPLGVRLEGDEEGLNLVRQALAIAGPEQKPSLYVREVEKTENVEFRLLARDGEYLITRPADDRPLVAQIKDYTPQNAFTVVQRLEHIARWTAIAELASPASSRIQPGAVQIQIYRDGAEIEKDSEIKDAQIRLEYQYENSKWKEPTFRVKLKNTSDEPLYCALLDLTERFSVTAGLFEAGGVWLQPGEEAWALAGKPLYGTVPKELWQQGVTEFKDILKLIVSTAEFDATLLEQDKLGLPTRAFKAATRGKGTLNRLMRRVTARDLLSRPEDEELYDDWVTSQVTFTIVRPQNAGQITADSSVDLGAGVKLQPHPSLQAEARLTTVPQATRDLGNLIVPPILREDPEVTQPFQFTASRGTDPGLSALELSNVADRSVVTPEAPLKLLVSQPLAEGEHLLPVAYDGEFFLPLGQGKRVDNNTTEITLERLPEPVSDGKRSLHGSIRIFFQKVLSEKLGLEFEYPILAAVDVTEDETASSEKDIEKVKERVAKAERIVLYIHGIIGDTQSLVKSVQRAKVSVNGGTKALGELYGLVLTFDYENINTSIEENARKLKQRLESVGLGANHGKSLHIIAHSMGGLISRWFIEREGGNQVVQHLVMLGTPNGGSPWPTVQAWATPALAIGLNSLSTVAWPVKVLGSLLSAIETIDVALDQMQPGSEFLKSLEASPDPGIPYTILAGNTSIIPAAVTSGQLKRLMQKLVRGAIDLPFFNQTNDIAVAVYSIKKVNPDRLPSAKIHEVACDHLTYFSTEAGLKALAAALAPEHS